MKIKQGLAAVRVCVWAHLHDHKRLIIIQFQTVIIQVTSLTRSDSSDYLKFRLTCPYYSTTL